MNDPNKSEPVAAPQAVEPAPLVTENDPSVRLPKSNWLGNLRRMAYSLLRISAVDPEQSDPAFWRKHDEEENENTRIPSGTSLRVPIIWGLELYGPTEIENLYTALERLDWSSISLIRDDTNSAARWIQKQRSYGSGGWMNIGQVSRREKSGQFIFSRNFAPLPSQVDFLLVKVFQLSPSLTGVLLGFRLNESAEIRYEEELNRDRITFRRRNRKSRSFSIISPESQKRAAVETVRADLRLVVSDWFQKHMPGYFCNLDRPTIFPTMELLIAQDGPILHQPEGAPSVIFFNWRHLLANVAPHEVWTSEDHSGLQLTMDRYSDEDLGLHIVVALDIAKFPEEKLKHWGGKTPDSYVQICHELLGSILAHASTITYLREQTRDLNAAREKLRTSQFGRRKVMHNLQEIRLFFDRTIGTPAIARELSRKSKTVAWYRHDCPRFTLPGWRPEDKPTDVAEYIRLGVHSLSSRLSKEETVMRSHFEQLTTILDVRESIRAQRRMEWLTVIALVVAVSSLIVALKP